MAPKSPKSSMISLRLTDAQKAWLKDQEQATGNEASATIRFLISQAMAAAGPAPVPAGGALAPSPEEVAAWQARREREEAERLERERREQERKATIARKRAELEALERGEDPDAIDAPQSAIYDDPDADSSTGEFDESQLADDPPVSDGGVQAAPATVRGPAFSVTRPAGFGADLRGGNQMGDARGNVLRDNFKFMGR